MKRLHIEIIVQSTKRGLKNEKVVHKSVSYRVGCTRRGYNKEMVVKGGDCTRSGLYDERAIQVANCTRRGLYKARVVQRQ